MKKMNRVHRPSKTAALRRIVRRHDGSDNESGQAMILVLGMILVITLGTTVLVQSTFQQEPIVSNQLLDHYAYRALEAAEADLLYNLNDNFEFLDCNSANTPGSDGISGTVDNNPPLSNSNCKKVTPYRTWEKVPGQSGNVPEWFAIDNPQFSGSYSGISNVQIQIVGAAGYNANDMHYQSVLAQFKPGNGFLLNLFWDNVQEVDPVIDSSTCDTWDWNINADASTFSVPTINGKTLNGTITNEGIGPSNSINEYDSQTNPPSSESCTPDPIYFTGGDVIKGPVFSNDSIYVTNNGEGTNGGWPVFDDDVTTEDPYCQFVEPSSSTDDQSSACSVFASTDIPAGTGVSYYMGGAGNKNGGIADTSPIPTYNQNLDTDALTGGCVYYGPTDITFDGSTMDVTNTSSAPSTCKTGVGVPLPANGIIYVADVPSQYSCTSTSLTVSDEYEYAQTTGSPTDGCRGDAVLNGALYGAVTVATSNNIIIDGDLVYCQDPTTSGGSPTCPSTPSGGALPSQWENAPSYPGTSSVLGLIADQFVEVNDPAETCTNNPHGGGQTCATPACTNWADSVYWTGTAGGANNQACVMQPMVIDAAILALQHSFIVINYGDGQSQGDLYVNGAIAQDFRGPVGLTNGSGYQKEYQWDWRLAFIAPPSYLVPAVNGNTSYAYWNLVSSSVNVDTPSCSHITFAAPMTGSSSDTLPCEPP